jgi:hypothetical protein
VIGERLRAYVHFALTVERGSLPGGEWALALQQHAWVAAVGLPGTFLILLFPDGRLPSPRWKPWAYFCALALVLSYVALTMLPVPSPMPAIQACAIPWESMLWGQSPQQLSPSSG